MKKTLLPLIFLCLGFTGVFSQDNAGGTPRSFFYNNLPADIDYVWVQGPDMMQLASEDNERAAKSEAYRIGVVIPVDFTLNNAGTWTELPGEDASIWRLTIKAANARAIGLEYQSFYLPEDAMLFVYNAGKTQTIGAYTSLNNSEDNFFTHEKIYGDELTLELYVPNTKKADVSLHITDLEFFYRPGENIVSKGSDACEVNVNCPEGANWQDEKKGVCLLDIKVGSGIFNCTGSLVNNTSQNCTPYVLLADHCIYNSGYPSVADCNAWKFYFHYEASTCQGTSPSGIFVKTGCTLKAHDTYGSNNSGSDFCLVQINTPILTTLNPYYNGWDRSGSGSTSGVGIHHPSADIMKISTFTTALASVTYGAPSSHWQVLWAPTVTNHGVTEQGSSGSPLFNSSGKIVGTLTGGGSFCSSPTQPDYYGKFCNHWDKNGTTSAKRLKDWLDPLNTGASTLVGKAGSTCPTDVSVSKINTTEKKISIYPSPAQNKIVLTGSALENKVHNITIYNVMGIAVKNYPELNIFSSETTIDISDIPDGVYYLTAKSGKTFLKGEFVKTK